jgi:hypothetical protein
MRRAKGGEDLALSYRRPFYPFHSVSLYTPTPVVSCAQCSSMAKWLDQDEDASLHCLAKAMASQGFGAKLQYWC